MYNFDEKGFIIGFGQAVKHIMTREKLQSDKIIRTLQDGNKEWILLLAEICVVFDIIPLVFISQRKSEGLKNSWIKDLRKKKYIL